MKRFCSLFLALTLALGLSQPGGFLAYAKAATAQRETALLGPVAYVKNALTSTGGG